MREKRDFQSEEGGGDLFEREREVDRSRGVHLWNYTPSKLGTLAYRREQPDAPV